MKVIISQQGKKLSVTFDSGKLVDNYSIDKADDFLSCLDKFISKRRIAIASLKKADLKFVNTGILTERIIRSIMAGLNFNTTA